MERAPASTRAEVVGWITFTVVYGLVVGHLASRRVFWSDEITSLLIASAPTWDGFWQSALHGPDTLPPLGHLLMRLTGLSAPWVELGARLPSVIAIWTACLCIYLMLRSLQSAAVSWSGVFFFLTTAAFPYAIEARPYGLLVGFSALAALCWVMVELRPGRAALWSIGLAAALFASVASHWFGVLTCGAVATLEIHRSVRRRVFRSAWVALVSAAMLCSLLYPFALNAREFSVVMARSSFPLWHLWGLYSGLLSVGTLVLLLVILAASTADRSADETPLTWSPVSEVTLALCLIPALGYLMAVAGVGVVNVRYVLQGAVGLSLVTVLVLSHAFRSRVALMACALVLAGGAFETALRTKKEIVEVSSVRQAEAQFALLALPLEQLPPSLPIMVSDLHVYLPLLHYAPPRLAERLVYVTGQNPQAAFQMARYDRWFPVRTLTQAEALLLPAFLAYDAGDDVLTPAAMERGWRASAAMPGHVDPGIFPRPGHLVLLERQ